MQYKVGDRIKIIKNYERDGGRSSLVGKLGIIVERNASKSGIQFDEEITDGHSCNGNGKHGHCWYMSNDYFKLNNPFYYLNTEES